MTELDPRRRLPQVARLVATLDHQGLPRLVVVDAVRSVIDAGRKRARRTKTVPSEQEIVAMCNDELARRRAHMLRPVINATGVILHTNLGRAPMSERAIEAVAQVAHGYSNLEFDLEHGRRGDRFVHVEPLLAIACGAEAALVVNNNAAAILLVCAALARDKEVVISRGELIEIGGEFRIPDVLAQSGATLREVGTTNRTHLRDYERAIGERTAFVLKVHPSNYRVVGFTSAPDLKDLSALAKRRGVPLVYDVGSGLLARPFADEPFIPDVLSSGADVACFSGDKLLGGPQAGIVAGRKDLLDELRAHPLLRALRPDKMQLAALGATVEAYLEDAAETLPVWTMIDATPQQIEKRAKRLAKHASDAGLQAEVVTSESVVGGGSVPGHELPTVVVRLTHENRSPKDLAVALRHNEPPIVARVDDGAVVVDLRTVRPDDDRLIALALSG